MDPLDGSSNIDVNVSVRESIFGIYRRISDQKGLVHEKIFFRKAVNW
ncbi:MAG: hypothetical protein R2788_00950 [Saprospiraceae bacterium]